MKALFLIFLLLFQLYPDLSQAAARIPAKSAILVDMDSGKVLYEKNADQPIPPASLTKIMTMYLALDMVGAKKVSLNKKFTVRSSAATVGGSSMHLARGEKVPLVRLLSGMAVVSGNDAAMAVAEGIGGDCRKLSMP